MMTETAVAYEMNFSWSATYTARGQHGNRAQDRWSVGPTPVFHEAVRSQRGELVDQFLVRARAGRLAEASKLVYGCVIASGGV